MKSGFVSVIGRPSSGKSTLINAICGHKISIVSSTPQTTRNKVKAIYTEDRGQLVFLDTPGYHTSEKSFNKSLNKMVYSSLVETDAIIYVMDITRAPAKEEDEIVDILKKVEVPKLIVINKIDSEKANDIENFISYLKENFESATVIPISALKKRGIEDLKETLFSMMPDGEYYYPEEFYTDQDPEFRITEIIREKTINRVSKELPHSIYVDLQELKLDKKSNLMSIKAVIFVEKESQKGIVVGKGGEKIGKIRELSKREIKSIFPNKIHLELKVKVMPKWRKNNNLVKKLIH